MLPPVLVVDDDDDIRQSIGDLLREEGYDVVEAENGQDALEVLARMDPLPCVILLDMMMPVMSGPEVIEALAGDPRVQHVPVVIVSAQARKPARERRFLQKPLSSEALLSAVRETHESAVREAREVPA